MHTHTLRKIHVESVTCDFFQRDVNRHLSIPGREGQRNYVTQVSCGGAEALLGLHAEPTARRLSSSHITEKPTTQYNVRRRGPAEWTPTAGSCSLFTASGPFQPTEVPESEEPPSPAWEGMVPLPEEIAQQPPTPVWLRKPGLVALRKDWKLEAGDHRLAYQQLFLHWGHPPPGCKGQGLPQLLGRASVSSESEKGGGSHLSPRCPDVQGPMHTCKALPQLR